MTQRNIRKTQLKTFKRFVKEEADKYYTLDLYSDMTKEEIVFYTNQLLQLILKMLKKADVLITAEPVLAGEQQS